MYGSIQNMDAPVLFFGQLFCDAEPETEMLPVCMGVICPVEAFEDMRLLFIRDTTAGVGEGEAEMPVLFPAGECDLSAGWSIAERVIHENEKNLFCAVQVAEAVRKNLIREGEGEPDVFFCWQEVRIFQRCPIKADPAGRLPV